jgi:dTDP-glucose 4,6-dehydratase
VYIPLVISKVLKEETVFIHSNPDKTKAGTRHYINTEDVADAVVLLLEKGVPGEKYNIVGEREVDNLTLAQMIAEGMGRELKYEMVDFHSSRPGHDLRYSLDGAKMRKDFDWEPRQPVSVRLKEVIDWTLENRYWIGE